MVAGKSILEEADVKRRYFAVLMIVGMLVVAAVPLAVTLSSQSADVDSSLEFVPTMYVPCMHSIPWLLDLLRIYFFCSFCTI